MAKTDEVFESALIGKKIPILPLDNKWHQLFSQKEFTPEIKDMEDELNGLLKRQSKVNDENREIKKLKKLMMDNIVVLADELVRNPTKRAEREQEECKRMVEECNEKLEACEEEMVELPRRINQLNNKLMLITMDICYRKLEKNTAELTEIETWIANVRRELKKKIIRKQEKEAVNHKLYSYMHDIFGAEVIELFDMKYDPEEKYQRAKEAKEAKENKETNTEKNTEGKSGEPETEQGNNSENASKS